MSLNVNPRDNPHISPTHSPSPGEERPVLPDLQQNIQTLALNRLERTDENQQATPRNLPTLPLGQVSGHPASDSPSPDLSLNRAADDDQATPRDLPPLNLEGLNRQVRYEDSEWSTLFPGTRKDESPHG